MNTSTIKNLESLGFLYEWEQVGGCLRTTPQDRSPRDVSRLMLDSGSRFITITATELAGGSGHIRLDYHWDLEGVVVSFTFFQSDGPIESIVDFCDAADWIEREVQEYFSVVFTGRDYEPLLLRQGQSTGVHLREEEE